MRKTSPRERQSADGERMDGSPKWPNRWKLLSVGLCLLLVSGLLQTAEGQQTPSSAEAAIPDTPKASGASAGGTLHGMIKSGSIPLPGVTVTATNTLTGKKFATTTDITGAWAMTIPQNGRYVLRTEFAAFAASTHEALLNANSHDQAVDFELSLASRVAQQDVLEAQQGQARQISQAMRQLGINGSQSLSLINSLATGTDAAEGGTTATGTALPGAAANSNFGGESVAINGQSGSVSPLAGIDVDRIRDAMETVRAQGGVGGGGGFFGGSDLGGGGFGGGPGGGFGGGRGNFRGFRADQPHGAIFWTGNNSALNALPYAIGGQKEAQPNYGSNRFGLTFIGQPYIPKLTKPSGKDTLFLTLSGTRTSTPYDQYATVPELTPEQQAQCPAGSAAPACKLLALYPASNLKDNLRGYNYFFASTAQSNSTQAGVRYIRSIGSKAGLPTGRGSGGGGGGGERRNRTQNQGLRQSVNANFNWSHSAGDNLNFIPILGGNTASDSYSLQTGYSLGYHRLNNNVLLGWNRTRSQAQNYYTNTHNDIASTLGIDGPGGGALNDSALNYGVPNIVLSGITGLNEQQPTFRLQQTISLTESLSWGHGKHNYRFGGDYRRVHQDVLGSSNATGTFYFTNTTDAAGNITATALDNLVGDHPQESTIQSSNSKSYLRENVWDLFAQDDYRAFSNLTLNYGLRYEFFSPFTEKYNHLEDIAANDPSSFTQVGAVFPGCSAATVSSFCGTVPTSLVYPFRVGFAPRVGIALRLPKSTVVRAGYGINYTNGQYASFATTLARQPRFANVQTNEVTTFPTLSLQQGFQVPNPNQPPNYSLDPHYRLPYVQVWNLDIQKTLPLGILLNAGYNGSKGTHLDITSAPRPANETFETPGFPVPVLFNYEQAVAFSNFNAATVRLRKRLQNGVSLGATYVYSHSIDNAGALGGISTVVAQNWQDLLAEEGNSSIDQRHKLTGDYLFELPFGKDKHFFTSGAMSKALEGLSVSGAFTFASGTPLTPSYAAASADVARGTAGSLRPDRVPGVSVTAGAGSSARWFNTSAFTEPAANSFGNVSRNSITGPGTISNSMSLSKTAGLGDIRSLEVRASASNVFNTVQYSGVDTSLDSMTAGQVTSAAQMRQFTFLARFRF